MIEVRKRYKHQKRFLARILLKPPVEVVSSFKHLGTLIDNKFLVTTS